jgi:membrane peptidoglycan carboxypeptidase
MADVPAPKPPLPRIPRIHLSKVVGVAGSRVIVITAVVAALAMLSALVALPLVVPAGALVRDTSARLGDVPPLAKALPKPEERTLIYANDGKTVLATLYGDENRKSIALRDMGVRMRRAVIAIEDYRFYEHEGIDYHGIARAAVEDFKGGSISQGGSTLTQQYIKKVVTGDSKTLDRKIREAIYAVQLEKRMSKNQILEAYLNEAYFGEGAYGVAAAAEHYFHSKPKDLSLAEAAALAATIAAPEKFKPTNPKQNKPRRMAVLDRMQALGWASSRDVAVAKREKVKIRLYRPPTKQPYFVEFIKQQLLHDHAYDRTLGKADTAARKRSVFEGGLRILTTLDPRDQDAAKTAVENHVAGLGIDGALASVEPATGKIIAMYGGRDFKSNQGNLAVLGQGSNGYQSGSSFKVFYLVSALEQGIKVSQTFNAPVRTVIRDRLCGTQGWDVGNAGESEAGVYNMYTATAHSVNTWFAQLMPMVRPSRALDAASRMGIQVPPKDSKSYRNNWDVCSSVLGTGNTSVLDMAGAFAVLADNGVRCQPYSIAKVTDRDGAVLLDRTRDKPKCGRVIDAGIAAQVTDILRGVVTGGTGVAAAVAGHPVAGKTGTAQAYTSAFFTGYTPQLATSVWVGHRSGLQSMYVGGRPVFGGTIPAPIFHDFMTTALAGLPAVGFPPPPAGQPAGPAQSNTGVPDVTGQQLAPALATLVNAGFKPAVRYVDNQAPRNQVVAQSPAAGSPVPKGSRVELQVSKGGPGGPNALAVPAVTGMRANRAAGVLRGAGFGVRVSYLPGGGGQAGRVVAQSPAAGAQVPKGTTVTLVVGRAGP